MKLSSGICRSKFLKKSLGVGPALYVLTILSVHLKYLKVINHCVAPAWLFPEGLKLSVNTWWMNGEWNNIIRFISYNYKPWVQKTKISIFVVLIFSVFYSPPNSPRTSECLERRSKLLCIMNPALSGPGFLWGFGSCLTSYNPTTPCNWFLNYIHLQGNPSPP